MLSAEQLREENHKLTLKLEHLQKTHASEVEDLKEELELRDSDFRRQLSKVREEAKAREAVNKDKVNELTEDLNVIREDYESVVTQTEKLKSEVAILRNSKATGSSSSYSEYEGLKETNRTLKAQIQEKDEIVTAHSESIRLLTEQLADCKRALGSLTEEVEGKDAALKDLASRLKAVEAEREEEVGLLQNEVITLKEEVKGLRARVGGDGGSGGGGGGGGGGADGKNKPGGGGGGSTSSRGNSLFSEVEERRLKVEGELSRLRALVKKLSEEKRVLQLEVERGDSHSANITTQLDVITRSEIDLQKEFKKEKSETLQMFDFFRQRLEQLRAQYIKKLQQYKSGGLLTPSQQSSELETLRTDRDNLQLLNIQKERENNELRRELKYNKHLRTNSEANVKILKAKLDYSKSDKHNNNGTTLLQGGGGGAGPVVVDDDENHLPQVMQIGEEEEEDRNNGNNCIGGGGGGGGGGGDMIGGADTSGICNSNSFNKSGLGGGDLNHSTSSNSRSRNVLIRSTTSNPAECSQQ